MKMLWPSALLLIVLSCKNPAPRTEVPPQPEQKEEKNYLPVLDVLKGDERQADSFATGVLLRRTTPAGRDSTYIQLPELKKMMGEFFSPELDSANFHSQFTETTLADGNSKTITFIYTSNSNSTALRRVMVYITPSQTIDRISRVYMEKEAQAGDTSISQKLTWKLKQYLIIVESRKTASGYESSTVRKAIWDPAQFGEQE
jgi:hypothetical protein